MPRPEFSQPGTKGGGDTVAVNNRPEIVFEDLTQTSSLASGASETIQLFAPTGSVYTINQMRIHVDADADWTTGSHKYVLDSAGEVFTALGESTYTNTLRFERGWWQNADKTIQPNDRSAMVQQMQSLKATENAPIQFRYHNDADAAQDNQRLIEVSVLEESY